MSAARLTVTFDSTGRDRGRLEGATGATGLRLLGEFAVLEVPQDGISHP